MSTVRVSLHAADPIIRSGISSHLRDRPEVVVLTDEPPESADVVVLVTDRVGSDTMASMRKWASLSAAPVVLVTGELSDGDLLIAVECRVMAVLPRGSATGERVLGAVMAVASGAGIMPPDLLGGLLRHVERLQREVLGPHGLNSSGLAPREVEVLRLMADGLDTNEIADQLRYSERTVKNVIYAVTTRLKLRNRAHAVAYALRAGII